MARTEEHFIWTGDYAARLDRLRRAVAAAVADESPRLLNEGDPAAELAEEYEALKAEAEEKGLRVVLRGLSDIEWDDIADQHPPRTDETYADNDKELGFNERTGGRDIIAAALVEPRLTRAEFDQWATDNSLTRGDIKALLMKAYRLTHGLGLTDPKSLAPLPTRSADEN